jgi:hypothetical protein
MKSEVLSWSEIRAFYEGIGGLRAQTLMPLVARIESSRYACGLVGSPGHVALCVTQVPVADPYAVPHLRITPGADGSVELRYVDTYVKADQWHRTVPASEAFGRLESFLEQLHWFSPEQSKT